ncbi:MAG: thermonuclease family protein [Parvibaculaceae bacterium]
MLARLLCLFIALTIGPSLSLALEGRAEIVDGDTLRIEGRTVRLQGIDAPETRQTCTDRSGQEWPCGREAARALARLAKPGPVACAPTGEDAYGRLLALCDAGGVSLNRKLVEDGWAYAFVRYDQRYVADEETARKAGRGLWQGGSEAPWEWRARKVTAAAAPEAPAGGCLIKGNISRKGERVYHLPWQTDYRKTRVNEAKGERWFCSEKEALGAGWRRALR